MGDTPAPEHLGRADLHLHTLASDGLMSWRRLLDHAEQHTALDLIAITDHDEVSAAHEAREWAARYRYRVQVVPGVEVTTRDGHLLVLFVEERPPALRPVLETAEWAAQRGGLCIAAHPFTRWTHSLSATPARQLAERGLLAGVEVMNASPAGRGSHTRARHFAQSHRLAYVGGSDAHMLSCVALSHTRFPGRAASDLRRAVEAGATQAEGRFARAGEIAAEALPQLARSMIHLPLRRLHRGLVQASPRAARFLGRPS
jgi:predicted metal-dependent phosphoesterase TrpH